MNKQILIAIGIVSAIVLLIFVFTSIPGENKPAEPEPELQSSDMSGHHEPEVANEEKFQALMGRQAPDFTLESYDQEQVNLKQLRGKKVVLFFTEGLMCYPSCWNQMAAFAKDKTFNNKDTVTLSIAVDRREEWGQAIEKMPELSSAIVLFDSDRKVSSDYGVLSLSSSMHKGQYPGHTYLILDKEGIVRFIEDDPQMGVRNDELKSELDKIN